MDIQLKTGCFEDAALVRRVVFMDEQGYENEFDAIDEAPSCIHVTLYVDGELAGCSRVFPEELERVADAEAPVSPACEMDEDVAARETYIMAPSWPGKQNCGGERCSRARCWRQAHKVTRARICPAALCQGRLHADRAGGL